MGVALFLMVAGAVSAVTALEFPYSGHAVS